MATSNIENFWNQYARYYKKICFSYAYQEFIQDTLTKAAITEQDSCLDLGCGPGYFAIQMSKLGGRVCAVDYSDAMIESARQNFADYHKSKNRQHFHIQLIQRDVYEFLLSVPDESIDVVIASLFLSYVKDPQYVVNQIYRILRRNGRFVMSNPLPNPKFSRIFWKSGWNAVRYFPYAIQILRYASDIKRLEKAGAFHFFNSHETIELLVQAGFTKPSIELSLTYADTTSLAKAVKELTP